MSRRRCQPRTRPAVELLEGRQLLSSTYYVSPTGRDTDPGTSPERPLQTLAAASALTLNAGDRVLLAGGATFAGTLTLTAADRGTAADPIGIGSYGTGSATIAAGGGDGIVLLDTGGVDISDVAIVGTSAATGSRTGVGIQLTNDLPGDVKLSHVDISGVDVNGFGFVGIGIGGTTDGAGGGSGFRDVRITASAVHGNVDAGIFSYAGAFHDNPAPYGLAHAAIYVADVQAYDNTGQPGQNDSGNGIKLGNVDGATVERSTAQGNGTLNTSTIGGPCGIWTYNSNAVVIQYCQSYANVSTHTDGGGFDLDGGTTNSLLQYNYSHDNAGAGILLAQFPKATAWSGNVVRYNVVQDDARKNNYGGIDVYAGGGSQPLSHSAVYGNTVYLSAVDGTRSVGLLVDGTTNAFAVYNNIFRVGPGMSPAAINNGGVGLTVAGNDYWNGSAAALDLGWLRVTYPTLSAFRAASKQERLGGTPTGLAVDPGLVDPDTAGTLTAGQPRTVGLPGFELVATSPLVDAGVSLTALGVNPGPGDFYGAAVPQGAGFDVGAAEWSASPAIPVATAVAVAAAPAAVVAVGASVTLTATVSTGAGSAAVPTGTVTFTLADGTVVGSGPVATDGTAALVTTALPAGVATVTAAYAGDLSRQASTATVTVTSNPPGLAPTVLRATVPTAVVTAAPRVGGKVTLSVTNATGIAYAGKATVELFAAPTGALDGSAVAVVSATRKVSLKAGRAATVTVAVPALPTTLTAGQYHWVARVTTAGGVASISPAGVGFTVSDPAVDLSLAVRSSRLPATAAAGRRVGRAVALSVSNVGNVATTGPLTVTLYLSADGSLSGAAAAVAVAKVKSAVRPGRPDVRLSVTVGSIPAMVAVGNYTVLVVATDAAGDTAVATLPVPLAVTG